MYPVIDREDLSLLGQRPFMDWEDYFYSPGPDRTYVLMYFDDDEDIAFDHGSYVVILKGKHEPTDPRTLTHLDRNEFMCTNAKWFPPTGYCGATSLSAGRSHFEHLRSGILMPNTVE